MIIPFYLECIVRTIEAGMMADPCPLENDEVYREAHAKHRLLLRQRELSGELKRRAARPMHLVPKS